MDTENTGQDSHKRCYEQSGKSSDISDADAKRHKNAEKQEIDGKLKKPQKRKLSYNYTDKRELQDGENYDQIMHVTIKLMMAILKNVKDKKMLKNKEDTESI